MRSQSVPAKRAGNGAEVVGGAGREVVRCGVLGDDLPGGAGVLRGAAGVLRAVDGASGTVGIEDELAVLAGAPEVSVLPLPHAATDTTVSVMHVVNPM